MSSKAFRLSMGAALVSLGWLLPTPASANMLANPGFEEPDASAGDVSTITGWNTFNDPNLSWVTRGVTPHGGSQVLKMFGPWNQWGGVGMTQAFAAAAGQTWTAGVWARNDSIDPMQGANFAALKIEFLDAAMGPAGGSWIAGTNVFEVTVANANSPLDVWQPFTLPAVAPAGTAFAQYVLVEVQGNDPPLGGSVFLDDASFVPEPASLVLLAIGGAALLRRRR